MLLDSNETKRSFAESFTRCYGHLMKDFIADDHEHSFSVTSLSVQVPLSVASVVDATQA
jgi:E3 ubiquitin-protein ligase UBR2